MRKNAKSEPMLYVLAVMPAAQQRGVGCLTYRYLSGRDPRICPIVCGLGFIERYFQF